jgi:histidinol-phosphatase
MPAFAVTSPVVRLSEAERDRFLAAALGAAREAAAIHRAHFRRPDLKVERKGDGSPVTPSDRLAEEALRRHLRRAAPELGCLGEEFGGEGSERDRWILDPLDGTKNFIAGLPYFAVLIALELGGELALGLVHAPLLGPGAGVGSVAVAADGATLGESWWAARGHGAWAGTGTRPESCRQRRLAVSETGEVRRAFLCHGGLRRIRALGLWPRFGELVGAVGRTRGFADWWGHVLVAEGRCDAMVEGAVAFHDMAPIQVLVEEAGGVFRSRGGAPLGPSFHDGVLSTNRHLAAAMARILGFAGAGLAG